MYWQKKGSYLAVKVERYTKSKKVITLHIHTQNISLPGFIWMSVSDSPKLDTIPVTYCKILSNFRIINFCIFAFLLLFCAEDAADALVLEKLGFY